MPIDGVLHVHGVELPLRPDQRTEWKVASHFVIMGGKALPLERIPAAVE
jgi:hypothetical protein